MSLCRLNSKLHVYKGILYKADSDPDPYLNLRKNRTTGLWNLCQNSLYALKHIFEKFEGADFKYDDRLLKF